MKQIVYEQAFSLLPQIFLGNLLALYKFRYIEASWPNSVRDCIPKLSFCAEKVNYQSFPIECHPYDYKNKNNGRKHQNYPHLLRVAGSQIFLCFVISFNFIEK